MSGARPFRPAVAVPALNAVARAHEAPSQPQAVFAAVDHALAGEIGHRLFTILSYDPDSGVATRLYSNLPDAYPAGGSKTVMPGPWTDTVLARGECYIGYTPDDLQRLRRSRTDRLAGLPERAERADPLARPHLGLAQPAARRALVRSGRRHRLPALCAAGAAGAVLRLSAAPSSIGRADTPGPSLANIGSIMESTLFKNAALLDPARPELLEGHDVLVENGLVSEVSDRPLSAASARVIDLKGKTLMPGLIDLHACDRGAAEPAAADGHAQRAGDAPLGADPARHAAPGLHHRARRRRRRPCLQGGGGAGLVQGPRLFVSGRALSQTGGHGDGRPRSDFMQGDSPCPCCGWARWRAWPTAWTRCAARCARNCRWARTRSRSWRPAAWPRLPIRSAPGVIPRGRDPRHRRRGARPPDLCAGPRLHRRGDLARCAAACAPSSTATWSTPRRRG